MVRRAGLRRAAAACAPIRAHVSPATAIGEIVRTGLVRWHHSQMGRYRGTSLYYKPVTAKDIERSFIQAGSEEDAARDAEAYTQLALNRATGWHRIALNPLVPAASAV